MFERSYENLNEATGILVRQRRRGGCDTPGPAGRGSTGWPGSSADSRAAADAIQKAMANFKPPTP